MENVPFVHLFCTSVGHYIYDVNTDTILKVSKDVYKTLKTGDSMSEEAEEYIRYLKHVGYLKSNRDNRETEHPVTPYLQHYLSKKVDGITLQLTQNCNLRCKYCVYSGAYNNRHHTNKKMSLETAKRGIDFLFDHSTENPEKRISFYGGEPLLEFETMKNCILYAEKKGGYQVIHFNFTTNATLLDEEKMDFLVKHNVIMLVSFDGPEEVHDQFRIFADGKEGSFSTVIKNLNILKKRHPTYYKERVYFNTVFAANKFSCVENYISSNELFRHSTFMSSLVKEVNRKNPVQLDVKFLGDYRYSMFLGFLYRLGRLDGYEGIKLLQSVIGDIGKTEKNFPKREILPQKWHHGGPCIPGVLKLFMDVNGNFYPCERVSENDTKAIIGNLNEGFYLHQIKEILNIENQTKEKCKECWAYQDCKICKACFETEISEENIKKVCDESRAKVETLYKDYCVIRELKNIHYTPETLFE